MKRQISIAALACACMIGAPALAQDQWQSQDQNQMRSLQDQISGTVEDLRIVQTQNQEQHLVLRVQLDDQQQGKTKFVDLGEARDIRNQNIQVNRGTNISITGEPGEINGRSILVANQITVEGQRYSLDDQTRQVSRYQNEQEYYEQQQRTYRAPGQSQDYQTWQSRDQWEQRDRRSSQDQARQMQQQDQYRQSQQYSQDQYRLQSSQYADQSQVIRGEVLSTRDFSLEGQDKRHRLMKVKDASQAGLNWVIDLGPTDGLTEVDLEKGDRVLVQGQSGRLEGRQIVRATQVAKIVDIERKDMAQLQSQSSPQLSSQQQTDREQQRLIQEQISERQQSQQEDQSMQSRIGKPQTGSSDQSTTSPDQL